VTLVSLFVYRTAADDELVRYADWLASRDAMWFEGRVKESLEKALRAAGELLVGRVDLVGQRAASQDPSARGGSRRSARSPSAVRAVLDKSAHG
jgi:hypothetical protein